MKQLLERLSLTLRRWRCYLQVREELGTYSERELLDMGMMRTDIPKIAREAAALTALTDRAQRQLDFYERQAGRKVAYPYV